MPIINYKRPSTLLIILSVIILCLGIGLAMFTYMSAINLRNDARVINESGIVRGMIQRVSKLAVAEAQQPLVELIKDLDELIVKLKEAENKEQSNTSEQAFYRGVSALEKKWNELKLQIQLADKNSIVVVSEECWLAANEVVYRAQKITEKKVSTFYMLFNLILILNALSVVFIILLVYLTVRKKLEHETAHDDLTGLSNRRAYDVFLAAQIARNKRYKMPVSLILFDIDFFKKVNDEYGHRTGDRVLFELAKQVENSIRKIDSVFRVGGEEFAIVCPDTNLQGAFRVAEKVRLQVEKASFDVVDGVTISAGVAELEEAVSKEDLFNNADQALYRAKHNGRNRTEVFRR